MCPEVISILLVSIYFPSQEEYLTTLVCFVKLQALRDMGKLSKQINSLLYLKYEMQENLLCITGYTVVSFPA